MKKIVLAALLFALGFSESAGASCGAAGCPMELQPFVDPDSTWTFDLTFEWLDQDQPRSGSSEVGIFGTSREHDEVRTVSRITTATLGWQPTAWLRVAAALPSVGRDHEHIHHDGAESERERWSFRALGDLSLEARVRLLERSAFSIFAAAAIELPTGDDEIENDQGEPAEITLTPGNGATDWRASAILSGALSGSGFRHGLAGSSTLFPWFVSAGFRRNGRGPEGYRIGEELRLDAGFAFPITQSVDATLQANARWNVRADVGESGEEAGDTGGRSLWLSPGLRYDVLRNVTLSASMQIPLGQHVNGRQVTADAAFVAGVRASY